MWKFLFDWSSAIHFATMKEEIEGEERMDDRITEKKEKKPFHVYNSIVHCCLGSHCTNKNA